MTIRLDPHGQPVNPFLNRARREDRDLSELLGLAKGMLCDGVVTDQEARYLYDWSLNHPDALERWPIGLMFSRLQHVFADGRIDEDERLHLSEILAALVGGHESLLLGYEGASTLPLDAPPPLICWGPDEVYVFTGRFAFGPRHECARIVSERGSSCEDSITRRTTFLVIGTFGSRDWAHSSLGRKIQRAMHLRNSGFAIRIVGEDHWAGSI